MKNTARIEFPSQDSISLLLNQRSRRYYERKSSMLRLIPTTAVSREIKKRNSSLLFNYKHVHGPNYTNSVLQFNYTFYEET